MNRSISLPQRMSGVVFIYLCLSYNIYPALLFTISISKIQYFNLKTLAPGCCWYQTGPLELKHCKHPSQVFFKGCLDWESQVVENPAIALHLTMSWGSLTWWVWSRYITELLLLTLSPSTHPTLPPLTNPPLRRLRQSEYRWRESILPVTLPQIINVLTNTLAVAYSTCVNSLNSRGS